MEATTPQVLPPQPPQTFSTPSAVPPVVPPVVSHNPVPTSSSTSSVEAQLMEAKAQIAALTKQLEVTGGSGLRQRNNPSSTAAAASAPRPSSAREVMQTATEQGVPVKIVAYLCLAAFLLAYLFF